MSQMIDNFTGIIDAHVNGFLTSVNELEPDKLVELPVLILQLVTKTQDSVSFAQKQDVDLQTYVATKEKEIARQVERILNSKMVDYDTIETLKVLTSVKLLQIKDTLPQRYKGILQFLENKFDMALMDMAENVTYAFQTNDTDLLKTYLQAYKLFEGKAQEGLYSLIKKAVTTAKNMDINLGFAVFGANILPFNDFVEFQLTTQMDALASKLFEGSLLSANVYKVLLLNGENEKYITAQTFVGCTEEELLSEEHPSGSILDELQSTLKTVIETGLVKTTLRMPEELHSELEKVATTGKSVMLPLVVSKIESRIPLLSLLKKLQKKDKVTNEDLFQLDRLIVNHDLVLKGTHISGFGYISLLDEVANSVVLDDSNAYTVLKEILQTVEGLSDSVVATEDVYTDIYLTQLEKVVSEEYYNKLLESISVVKVMQEVVTITVSENTDEKLIKNTPKIMDYLQKQRDTRNAKGSLQDVSELYDTLRALGDWTYEDFEELVDLFFLVEQYDTQEYNKELADSISSLADVILSLETYKKGHTVIAHIEKVKETERWGRKLFSNAPNITYEDLIVNGFKVPHPAIPTFNELVYEVIQKGGYVALSSSMVMYLVKISSSKIRLDSGNITLEQYLKEIDAKPLSKYLKGYKEQLTSRLAKDTVQKEEPTVAESQPAEVIEPLAVQEVSETQKAPNREEKRERRSLFEDTVEPVSQEPVVAVTEPEVESQKGLTAEDVHVVLEKLDVPLPMHADIRLMVKKTEDMDINMLKTVTQNYMTYTTLKETAFTQNAVNPSQLENLVNLLGKKPYSYTELHTDVLVKYNEVGKVTEVLEKLNNRIKGSQVNDGGRFLTDDDYVLLGLEKHFIDLVSENETYFELTLLEGYNSILQNGVPYNTLNALARVLHAEATGNVVEPTNLLQLQPFSYYNELMKRTTETQELKPVTNLKDLADNFSLDLLEVSGFKKVNGQLDFYVKGLHFMNVLTDLQEVGVQEGNKVLDVLEELNYCIKNTVAYTALEKLEAIASDEIAEALVKYINKTSPETHLVETTSSTGQHNVVLPKTEHELQTASTFTLHKGNVLAKEFEEGKVHLSVQDMQAVMSTTDGLIVSNDHLLLKIPATSVNMPMLVENNMELSITVESINGRIQFAIQALTEDGTAKAIQSFRNYVTLEILTKYNETLREGNVVLKTKKGETPLPYVLYQNSIAIKALAGGVVTSVPYGNAVKDITVKEVETAVQTLTKRGVMSALTTTRFVPKMSVTYYSMLEVITKSLGLYKKEEGNLATLGTTALKDLVTYSILTKKEAKTIQGTFHEAVQRRNMFDILARIVKVNSTQLEVEEHTSEEFEGLKEETVQLLTELDRRMVLKRTDDSLNLEGTITRQELAYYLHEVLLITELV